VEHYNRLCVSAIRDLLRSGDHAAVLRHDPTGQDSLARAREVRRKLRQLRRRKVPIEELRRRYLDVFLGARNKGEVPEIG
jgi:hypothetical protein